MEILKQWVCDVCGGVIEKPEDGYVVWNKEKLEYAEFDYKILHCGRTRIREDGKKFGCDNNHSRYPYSASIVDFLGSKGLVNLLSMIDVGPLHRSEYKEQIKDMRGFVEFFRRVQLPYYEEARLYWGNAYDDGYFNGANEVWTYLPSTLEELIKRYK